MDAHQVPVYNHNSATQMYKTILNDENNVLKLVRIFRSHECLWNPNCENYRYLALKESIWDMIAEQFGSHVTADQVKRKVKGLRNCFSTERSRVQKSLLDGRGEIYVPTLYYYKEFDFLQGITKGLIKGNGNIKSDFGDEYDENHSPCDESTYNMNNPDHNDFSTNDNSSNQNEDMKIFEPIVLNKSEFELPPYKKVRTYSSYSVKSANSSAEQPKVQSKNATQVQSLCEMVRVDLEDVSDDLFYDAKWKILDVLREVHKKHIEERKLKNTNNKKYAMSSRTPLEKADTSSGVITSHQYSQQ